MASNADYKYGLWPHPPIIKSIFIILHFPYAFPSKRKAFLFSICFETKISKINKSLQTLIFGY